MCFGFLSFFFSYFNFVLNYAYEDPTMSPSDSKYCTASAVLGILTFCNHYFILLIPSDYFPTGGANLNKFEPSADSAKNNALLSAKVILSSPRCFQRLKMKDRDILMFSKIFEEFCIKGFMRPYRNGYVA